MNTRQILAVTAVLSTDLLAPVCFGQGWVVLPVSEYQSLRAKAYPPATEPTGPPVEATLTRVDYDLHVDGSVASGTAQLTIDVLKEGWVRVPFPPGLLVREARLGNDFVPLVSQGANQLAAVLSKKGRSVLTLQVALTVSAAPGEARLSLAVGSSGSTRAAVALDQQDVAVTVTGGLPPEKKGSQWISYAAGSEPLRFTWRKKIEDHHVELPLRMRGSLTQLFGLGEDSTSLNAEVHVDVIQGAARQIKVAVPDTVTINQVPGALVADWDVKNGILAVNLLDPVEQSVSFTIAGETRLAREGPLSIPLLRLLDAERETGGVAVEVLGAGEIKESKPQGLEPAEAAQLGALVAGRESPSLAAFRPRPGANTRALDVQVVRYAQQAMLTANIEEARYRALLTSDGKALVEARYAVRNNQRDFVKAVLPQGAILWSASVAGKPVRAGESPDGGILIPLDKNRAGEEAQLFAVVLQYFTRGEEWSAKGRASLVLPTLDLPVSRTGLMVYYPPVYRIAAEPGAFHVAPYEDPSSGVLNGQTGPAFPPDRPVASSQSSASELATQLLVDRYRARSGPGRLAAPAAVEVAFPSAGPSLFLVSELTSESTGPSIDLSYQKGKDGGAQ